MGKNKLVNFMLPIPSVKRMPYRTVTVSPVSGLVRMMAQTAVKEHQPYGRGIVSFMQDLGFSCRIVNFTWVLWVTRITRMTRMTACFPTQGCVDLCNGDATSPTMVCQKNNIEYIITELKRFLFLNNYRLTVFTIY